MKKMHTYKRRRPYL